MHLHATPEPNRRHIPGIYNYCDRWCERCPFADRCAVHAVTRDLAPESRVDPLLAQLRARFDMVAAARRDWEALDGEESTPCIKAPADLAIAQPPLPDRLLHDARTYAVLVDAWFETEAAALCERADELVHRVSASSPHNAADPADRELVIAAIEIVRHDAWVIPIKLARALHDGSHAEIAAGACIQNDRNGSAKVALLAMDRSEASWRVLDEWLRSGSAALLAQQLVVLRVATEQAFPHARRFLRPGFDGV